MALHHGADQQQQPLLQVEGCGLVGGGGMAHQPQQRPAGAETHQMDPCRQPWIHRRLRRQEPLQLGHDGRHGVPVPGPQAHLQFQATAVDLGQVLDRLTDEGAIGDVHRLPLRIPQARVEPADRLHLPLQLLGGQADHIAHHEGAAEVEPHAAEAVLHDRAGPKRQRCGAEAASGEQHPRRHPEQPQHLPAQQHGHQKPDQLVEQIEQGQALPALQSRHSRRALHPNEQGPPATGQAPGQGHHHQKLAQVLGAGQGKIGGRQQPQQPEQLASQQQGNGQAQPHPQQQGTQQGSAAQSAGQQAAQQPGDRRQHQGDERQVQGQGQLPPLGEPGIQRSPHRKDQKHGRPPAVGCQGPEQPAIRIAA